jgi:hypothetical protein
MTGEQRTAFEQLRALAAPLRLRVRAEVEGWPVFPGKLGHIEPVGPETLAVYTDRPRLFAKLWAVPGVRRHQSGDTEMRALLPPSALAEVARIIRARVRRAATLPASLAEHAYRSPSRPKEAARRATPDQGGREVLGRAPAARKAVAAPTLTVASDTWDAPGGAPAA